MGNKKVKLVPIKKSEIILCFVKILRQFFFRVENKEILKLMDLQVELKNIKLLLC